MSRIKIPTVVERMDAAERIESKHTPGPWSLAEVTSGGSGAELVYIAVKKQGEFLGFAGTYLHDRNGKAQGRISPEEARANANLLALAPELFDALRKVEAASAAWDVRLKSGAGGYSDLSPAAVLGNVRAILSKLTCK